MQIKSKKRVVEYGEVFTSIREVNAMLDLLPDGVIRNGEFLEPACGSGNFVVEIIRRKINLGVSADDASRAVTAYDILQDNVEETINRVFNEFGVKANAYAVDSLSFEWGKFNVVITNPPYQLKDGGHGASARPIYHKFVERAKNMADHVVMIIPARWYAGGKGLDEFRATMLADTHLKEIVDMPDATEAFPGNAIAGGVCYFHWDKNYKGLCKFNGFERNLNEYDVLIRDHNALSILKKVLEKSEHFFNETVTSRKPFGLRTNFTDFSPEGPNTYPCRTKEGTQFVEKSKVTHGLEMIPKWKSICSAADGAASVTDDNGQQRVLSRSEVLKPNEICLETYLLTGTYKTKKEAENAAGYLLLKLPRFLLSLRKISQHLSKDKFKWVPLMDVTRTWTDEMLYEYFELTAEEINTIESSIK